MPGNVFVYVSNAADGDISTYRLAPTGELEVRPRVPVAEAVMPMTVSRDKRFLYAAARSKPFRVFAYAIERGTGALTPLGSSPLAESMPYIALDRTDRFLLAASYGGHVISVNRVGADGRVSPEASQVIQTGRNPHSIRIDATNRFIFVPNLGSGIIMQFVFDAASGRMAANTPPVVLARQGLGPRHCLFSDDNRFLYVLDEFLAAVTVYALDETTGLLTWAGEACGVPAEAGLKPGAPRAPVVAGSTAAPPDTSRDIWAADIRLTPDGRFLYISERTGSTLAGFAVNRETGLLTYRDSTSTERQPRGFAIDPTGRFLVACGEESDQVSVHAIGQADGALTRIGRYPGGKGANWVEIVGFD